MSEADFERAEQAADQQRDAGVKAAGVALKQHGTLDCIDCGFFIPDLRRRAFPSARRCVDCQEFAEQEKYHR